MSVIDSAKFEMKDWDAHERDTMVKILELFFDEWDSGGAVYVMAPILQRLIACKPLSPLTGNDDEWHQVDDEFMQNKRIPSVFKTLVDIPHRNYKAGDCYDI